MCFSTYFNYTTLVSTASEATRVLQEYHLRYYVRLRIERCNLSHILNLFSALDEKLEGSWKLVK